MKFLFLMLLSFSAIPQEPKVINVLIVDTGIARHGLLKNVVYNSSDDYVDINGHGTHIAGLIQLGKDLNDSLCPEIRLRSCKYYDYTAGIDSFSKCIQKGVDTNVDYLNVSGGGSGFDANEYKAFKAFKGLAYVAAGNNGVILDNKKVYYPASYRYKHNMKNIVMVQGLCDGKLCPYSNTHPTAIDGFGDYVKSTSINNDFTTKRGTSQATAIALHEALKKKCNEFKGVKNANR